MEEITALCERLDPSREPGRLTLIARMGAETVGERLPALVEAVRVAGHPVIWLSDPMHGNTVVGPDGHKTRLLETMAREVRGFLRAVTDAGGTAGGLHLETTPDDVLECAADVSVYEGKAVRRTSLCDPRLNPEQAVSLVSVWPGVDVPARRPRRGAAGGPGSAGGPGQPVTVLCSGSSGVRGPEPLRVAARPDVGRVPGKSCRVSQNIFSISNF